MAGDGRNGRPPGQRYGQSSLTDFETVSYAFASFRLEKTGIPWTAGVASYSKVEDAATALRNVADAVGKPFAAVLDASLAGFGADDRARACGFPLGWWTQDVSKYYGFAIQPPDKSGEQTWEQKKALEADYAILERYRTDR